MKVGSSSVVDPDPRIHAQCCGSGMFIPDPTFFHPGSSKNLSILTPKKAKIWFLSSKKYDPGCLSRIPDPDAEFLPSRIQGSKRHPIPDPDPQHCLWLVNPDLNPDPAIFVIGLQDANKKLFLKKFLLVTFSKIKSQKSHKTVGTFFLIFFLDDRRIRIHTSDKWIRIQEAQKHTDPTNPDPQHWLRV